MMFTNKDLRRLIVPLIGEQALAMLVGMADTMMVSHAGEAAVSGVTLVDMIGALVLTLLSAAATGGAVVVSQYLGRRDRDSAARAAGQTNLLTLILSMGMMAIGLTLYRPILRGLFGAIEDSVMTAASTYFIVCALSYPFLGAAQSASALFRSLGETKITLYASILMNAVNVIGNAIGVFVLRAGVLGVAIPTLLSRMTAGILLTALAMRRKNDVRLTLKDTFAADRAMMRRILNIALPNGIENGLFTLGRVLVVGIVAMFGTAQIAANGVASSVNAFAIIIVNAVNLAVVTVVGRCVGAGEYEQAQTCLKKLMIVSYVATLTLSLAVAALLPALRHLYDLSDDTWTLCAKLILAHNAMATLLHPTSFNVPNALRAAGDARFTMVAGIASMLVFRLGTAYALGLGLNLGIWGVWIAMGMDWLGRSILFTIRYRTGHWKECRAI